MGSNKMKASLCKSLFVELFGSIIKNDKNWTTNKLKDIQENYNNFIINNNNSKYWLLTLDTIESNTGHIFNKNIVDKDDIGSSTFYFNDDSVLYSKLRPYLNKVVVPDEDGYATTELVAIYPNKEYVNKFFLAEVLKNQDFVNFSNTHTSGTKMPRVSMKDFWNFDLIIPPIKLQNNFIECISKFDKLKFIGQQILEKIELLKKSLFIEMFGDPNNNPLNFETIRLSEAFILQMGKTPSRGVAEYWDNSKYKWISISDLSKYNLYTSETKEKISEKAVNDTGIKLIPKNTVIMSFKLSIGKTAITSEPIFSNEAIMAFIPKNTTFKFNTIFLSHLLSIKDWEKYTSFAVMGGTLNKKTLSNSLIIAPPYYLQNNFSQKLIQIDKLKLVIEKQLSILS